MFQAPTTTTVKYIGAGRWAVTQDGKVVGILIQNSIQAWYAVSAAGTRLAVNGHHEYGGPAHPSVIAATMVIWDTPATPARYPEMGDDSQPYHITDPYGD